MLQCFLSFLNACLLTSYYALFVWKHIFRKVSQIDVLRYFCSSERELKGQFPISLLSILTQFCDFVSIQRAGWPTCRCLDWKWNHFTRSIALHFYLNSLHISNGNVKNIVKLPWHQNWEYCFCSGSGWHSWNRPVCLASSFFRANVLKFCTKKS